MKNIIFLFLFLQSGLAGCASNLANKSPRINQPAYVETGNESQECKDYRIDIDRRLELKPASFHVDGEDAVMIGIIGKTTPRRVEKLFRKNQNLKRVVMFLVPGSEDDEANLQAARMIRKAGIDTCVPIAGEIASGGVDFFLAGVRRSAARGAKVGVHSWEGDDNNGEFVVGSELSRSRPEHLLFLNYYEEMGIPPSFYWFTLASAAPSDIHWMSEDELVTHAVVTE